MKTLINKIGYIAAAIIAAGTISTSSALTLTIGSVLGTVDPGTYGDPDLPELVSFLAEKHNLPTAAGVNVGDNPDLTQHTEINIIRTQFGFDVPTEITFQNKVDNGTKTHVNQPHYDYILGKYGNDVVVWYIGNLPQDGTIILPNKVKDWFPELNGGLSHTSFLNGSTNVPDGGATAALLGLGVLGLAVIRRKS